MADISKIKWVDSWTWWIISILEQLNAWAAKNLATTLLWSEIKQLDVKDYTWDLSLLNCAMMNYWVYADSNSSQPIISTYWLGPCICVCWYNRKFRTWFLSHNSALTNFELLQDNLVAHSSCMIKNGMEPLDFDIYIIGWNEWSESTLKYMERIRKYISKKLPTSRIIYIKHNKIDNEVLTEEKIIERAKDWDLWYWLDFALDTRDWSIYSLSNRKFTFEEVPLKMSVRDM